MIFGRTGHRVSQAEGKAPPRIETRTQGFDFKPGAEIEATDGRTYVVTPEGSIVRPGKIKASKKTRRKARAIARAELGIAGIHGGTKRARAEQQSYEAALEWEGMRE